jgi:O-antigen/teichoic acid export membrane protein
MVRTRDGNEVDLLTSSIRTTGGATVSTTLYVLSGVVYAFVTSPAATGQYFFLALSIALVLRPVRGLSQTLQKLGSEQGESVSAYLGIATGVAAGYVALVVGVAYVGLDTLAGLAVFNRELFWLAALFAVSTALTKIVERLVAAAGYPSAVTWLNSLKSGSQLLVLLLFNPAIATVGDLMTVVIATRVAVFGLAWVAVGVVPSRPDRGELARAWAFAKWSIPDQVLDRLSYNMPVYVLGVVSTPLAVGVYETADRLADFGATIAWQLSSPLLTKVSGDTAADNDVREYLDAAVTGGTGVTFLVLGYLLAAHGVIADIAFSTARTAFSTTVLLVGTVNVLRGFWTLSSHAIEGVGRPSVSFRTKVLGLAVGAPVTAVYGSEFGAVAGAAGYVVMNVAVCGYVAYHARDIFGTSLVDWTVAARLALGLGVTLVGVSVSVGALTRLGASSVVAAVTAALVAIAVFAATLGVVSGRARHAFGQAYTIYVGGVRRALDRYRIG